MRHLIITLIIIVLTCGSFFGQPPIDLSTFWLEDGSSKFDNYKLDSIIGTRTVPFWAIFLPPFYRDVIVEYNEDCTLASLTGMPEVRLPIHKFEFDNGLLSGYINVQEDKRDTIEENYSYNHNGQLIEEKGMIDTPDGFGNWRHEFLYDSLGRLIVIKYKGEVDRGTPTPTKYDYIETFKYDSLGNIVEELRLSPFRRDTLRFHSYLYDGTLLKTEFLFQTPQRADTISYEYDDEERLVTKISIDYAGEDCRTEKEEFSYSDEGNLLEYKSSHKENDMFVFDDKIYYSYNSDNLEVGLEDYRFFEGEWKFNGLGEKRYNEDGLLIYELRQKTAKEYFLYYSAKECITSTVDSDLKFEVIPNPSSTAFTITNHSYQLSHIELYNLSGIRLFRKSTNNSEQLSFGANLLPGVYFLVMINDNGKYNTKKVVKQ